MQLVLDQYWFKKTEIQPEKLPDQDTELDLIVEETNKLLCSFCKNHITDIGEAIPINSAHTHTFTNPAGFVYTVSCYRTAPGCLTISDKTDEFSWFPGYEWQIALCNSCQEQLGWLFSNENQFYALIANRLILEK